MGLFEKKEKEAVEEVLTAEDIKEIAPLYEKVILALKQVYDPEIPVNIYDLGLIYELNIRKSRQVYIKMTFTAPNCPMADEVMAEVKSSVEDVPGVTGSEIELVFEPAWDQSMLSDEARVILGYDIDFDDDDVEPETT
jgi:FeS assembly SUF system protein